MSARINGSVPEATVWTLKAPLSVSVGQASECQRLETSVTVWYGTLSVLGPWNSNSLTLLYLLSTVASVVSFLIENLDLASHKALVSNKGKHTVYHNASVDWKFNGPQPCNYEPLRCPGEQEKTGIMRNEGITAMWRGLVENWAGVVVGDCCQLHLDHITLS